jgi:hypothetical protein
MQGVMEILQQSGAAGSLHDVENYTCVTVCMGTEYRVLVVNGTFGPSDSKSGVVSQGLRASVPYKSLVLF